MTSTITTVVSAIIGSYIDRYSNIMVTLSAVGVLTLIASLVVKELASAGGRRGCRLGRNLDVVILPLLYVLVCATVVKIWGILFWR